MNISHEYQFIERPEIVSTPITATQINATDVSISCYDREIPPFVEAELNRVYENIFSSLAKFKIYGSVTADVSTYVVREGGEIITLFLFRRDGQRVMVLNEFINTDEEEINRFAHYIFSNYAWANSIWFGLVRSHIQKLDFPHQLVNCNEDIVLSLPDSTKEYQSSLGKSTRQNINYYRNRLKRDFPTFSYDIYEKENISEEHFRDVIRLSKSRMAGKEKTHGFGEKETSLLIKLAKIYGMLGVVTINGRVCAGAICYHIGKKFYLYVIAHDSEYNDYGLGTYCCFLTICECIARGGKEYHFLWGREEYKYRLLGAQQDFDSLSIYRSQAHRVLDARKVLKTAYKGYSRQAMLWLLAPERRNSKLSQFAIKSMRNLRKLKQLRPGVQASK